MIARAFISYGALFYLLSFKSQMWRFTYGSVTSCDLGCSMHSTSGEVEREKIPILFLYLLFFKSQKWGDSLTGM
jgi:hypothetical protein